MREQPFFIDENHLRWRGGDAQSALRHRRCRLKPELSYIVIPRLALQGDGNLPYMLLRGGRRPTKSNFEF